MMLCVLFLGVASLVGRSASTQDYYKPVVLPGGLQPHQFDDYPHDGDEYVSSDKSSEFMLQGNARRLMAMAGKAGISAQDPKRNIGARCRLTRGDWCGQYDRQEPLSWKPAPRGAKECAAKCTINGNCNHDTGRCDCPAGWTGEDCSLPQKRPCTNRYRERGSEPASHIDENGRDLNWETPGWMMTRCPGICDDNIAACYCDGKYKYIPPPKGSPFGTPPVQYGRMLGDHCFPKKTKDGRDTSWGNTDFNNVYGERGWCEADHPSHSCGCLLDGYHGDRCDQRFEQLCPNQCMGHGECMLGFCKCHAGWYGTDCSRKKAGQEMEESLFNTRPWLKLHVGPSPEAQPALPATPRKRPLIYIYDLPSDFNSRMLQYKLHSDACTYRKYTEINTTRPVNHNLYSLELYLHEALSQSEHRTFDPEQADFFYVPAYVTCWIFPVFAGADFPWYFGPIQNRAMQASNFMLAVKRWIQANFPFWNKRNGRDHIWLMPHDEMPCHMPNEIKNTSIILTHWGRMDRNHKSNTAYTWDNYSEPIINKEYQPEDWRKNWQGGVCYDPSKDLVVPSYKYPEHFKDSPLMGALPTHRHILMYFKGDVGTGRLAWYSRGIRQKLYTMAKEQDWKNKFNLWIGFPHDLPPGYSNWLVRSKFCLVAPGDGWSARMEDAILHGCIPAIIMDNVHVVYESILDIDQFALRIREDHLHHLPQILLAVPEEKIRRMQRRIARIWHRYAYATGPYLGSTLAKIHDSQMAKSAATIATPAWQEKNASLYGHMHPRAAWPYHDDAFSTIMQWLYSRIPDTR